MSEKMIPAATIVLLRDEPKFEVLMVERHADIAFAGGALVFPGGRIDVGDHNTDWAGCCDGWENIPAEQRAPRIAALREAFEETGVLIARRDGVMITDEVAASLGAWRAKVEVDDALFLEMVRGAHLRLAGDALHLFSRWRPPKGVTHRRYDTWFFTAHLPAEQIARADGHEATEAVWTSPRDALNARDAGERKMIFPTSRNVELLNCSINADGVIQSAQTRIIRPVEPEIVKRADGVFLTIPDDMGYPITEERADFAMRS